jgi:hypothetical protein
MPYVTIEVLQEDVDETRGDPRFQGSRARFCPVARATCRALGLPLGPISVGAASLSIWGRKDQAYLEATTSTSLAREIARFDHERHMKPATYRIILEPQT